MMVGIGTSLLITGILALVVADNFKPDCAKWKRQVIAFIIALGAMLLVTGHLV